MDAAEKAVDEFQLSREELLKLWEKVKARDVGELSEVERFYAGIIEKHEAMFLTEVDGVKDPQSHEYPPEGVNPYLHILLHGLVETQVLTKKPIEVISFANAMKKRGLTDHAIEHLLCSVLFPVILEGRNRGGETDMVKYAGLLRKLKTKKPEKIDAVLGREFHQTLL